MRPSYGESVRKCPASVGTANCSLTNPVKVTLAHIGERKCSWGVFRILDKFALDEKMGLWREVEGSFYLSPRWTWLRLRAG